jgi:hypothetical protein
MTISGHKTRAVFERYNIVDQRDIRQAVERLEPSQNQTRTSQFGHDHGHDSAEADSDSKPGRVN